MIVGIPAANYDDIAHVARPLLRRLSRSRTQEFTTDELEAGIRDGTYQLWAVDRWRAIVLTRVSRNFIWIEGTAGDTSADMQERIEAELLRWKDHKGKDAVLSVARPGWWGWFRRRGKRRGWRIVGIVAELKE